MCILLGIHMHFVSLAIYLLLACFFFKVIELQWMTMKFDKENQMNPATRHDSLGNIHSKGLLLLLNYPS